MSALPAALSFMSKHLYGIPYMGSKTKIARDILKELPVGGRFVDLFGGGFAMSHAALLTHRYKKVIYNDYNRVLVQLVVDAIAGRFNYKNFTPEFISREEFAKRKDEDGYIKYIWSFGNNGNNYLFGKEVEPIKKYAHDFIVFGKLDPELEKIAPGIGKAVKDTDIHGRRLEFTSYCKKKRASLKKLSEKQDGLKELERAISQERLERLQQLQQLTQLERLQQVVQLEQLTRLERLQQLQSPLVCSVGSYDCYEYMDGDIVYCDPPYEGTAEYDDSFNHKAFYDWVASRPYQIWFSSYKISDDRFNMVFARQIRGTLAGAEGAVYNFERLYTNR